MLEVYNRCIGLTDNLASGDIPVKVKELIFGDGVIIGFVINLLTTSIPAFSKRV